MPYRRVPEEEQAATKDCGEAGETQVTSQAAVADAWGTSQLARFNGDGYGICSAD